MSKIITTDNNQQYQTANGWKTFGAIYAGSIASSAVTGISQPIALACMNKMQKLSQNCDTVQLQNSINNTFNNSILPRKGVEFIEVAPPPESSNLIENIRQLLTKEKTLEELHPKNPKLVKVFENATPKYIRKIPFFKDAYQELLISTMENGNNACYLPKGKKVIVNTQNLGLSAFHEMGHAINHNCTKFWKIMQKSRTPMKRLGGLFALTALFKRKKLEGEEPKNIFDKATTFVKNNVGKLVTLTFIPMVAEELMASRRGNKMAAQVLPKDMLKKVKMSNRLGAVTYITAAVVSGAGAYLASKVRDNIAKPKLITNNTQ